METINAIYQMPQKITPIPVTSLVVGKYYRDVLTGKLIRVIRKYVDGVEILKADKDGDVERTNLYDKDADYRFYDDGTIAQ
jgi:hypothetical protein